MFGGYQQQGALVASCHHASHKQQAHLAATANMQLIQQIHSKIWRNRTFALRQNQNKTQTTHHKLH
jgi:hypothetical protein